MNAVQTNQTELDKRAVYARLIGDGIDPAEAARRAGYADPEQSAFLLSQDLSVVKSARRWQFVKQLNGANLSHAQTALGRLLQDQDTPPHVLIQAIDKAYSFAGLNPAYKAQILDDVAPAQADVNPSQGMNVHSLAATLDKLLELKGKLALLDAVDVAAVDVTPTLSTAAQPSQFDALGL